MGPRDEWAQAQHNALLAALFAGCAGAIAFGAVGFAALPSLTAVFGTVGFVVGVAVRMAWLKRRKARLDRQATLLNAQVDALKQKEFELRYEAARQAGAFNRWDTQK